MSARPCIRSGFCCKQGTCPYGVYDIKAERCRHLVDDVEVSPGQFTTKCAIYDHINEQPESIWSPAFGAGCCSPMFNPDRDAIINAARGGVE